ncbi:hypothetical protein RAJCM14343_1439 [Rhodococcus aetherivorans]|uniref:Uncharacterized protein n=1 Tax=Rhodococcus aetherivorans TaxID=191292 RepID=A0ABQ0YI48_9NOCA|nr:hypothetical protein RAJCM14343_1439 [Rhodococcus aetherivorans]CCW14747.1 hypothetical protein EBESD8_53170 [Rhodococcus aetherivorans]
MRSFGENSRRHAAGSARRPRAPGQATCNAYGNEVYCARTRHE